MLFDYKQKMTSKNEVDQKFLRLFNMEYDYHYQLPINSELNQDVT